MFWGLATLAAVFVGLGKGGLPVVAALAVPSLALIISPIAAAGLLLPVYIVSDVFALAAYRRDYNKQVLKIAVIAMSFGVLIGGLTAHFCITKGLALAPAIVVIPLDFLRLPLISAIGFLAYGEAFEWPVVLGAILIFTAVLVNLQAEHQRNNSRSKG